MNLRRSKIGSSSCHCTTTFYGEHREIMKIEWRSPGMLQHVPTSSRKDVVILGPGSEKKWYGTCTDKPDGDWDKTAERMMLNLAESGHPKFRANSALERGESRSKEKGKEVYPLQRLRRNIELILRTIISVNQLSIYGAVADLCKELPTASE